MIHRKIPYQADTLKLPSDYGSMTAFVRAITWIDKLIDPILSDLLYELWFGATTLLLQWLEPTAAAVSLDLASSESYIVHLTHSEIEFFVPVDILGKVGAYMDKYFKEQSSFLRDTGLWALRYVYGSESLTAYNGVNFFGNVTDVVAVNHDSYQRSNWARWNTEFIAFMAALSAEFPRVIRLHAGKFNPPMDPDPENAKVKELLRKYDPAGIFSRKPFDASFLTAGLTSEDVPDAAALTEKDGMLTETTLTHNVNRELPGDPEHLRTGTATAVVDSDGNVVMRN